MMTDTPEANGTGITYRDATSADGAAVGAIFRESFTATFGHLYSPENLRAFLDDASDEWWCALLGNPAISCQLALVGGTPAGYALLGPVEFPGDWPQDAVELRQLYVLPAHHGCGIGPVLLDWTIAAARRNGASELVLSVFVDNHRARRLYEARGFVDIGRYDFRVGDHVDEDRLMRLTL